MSSSLNHHIFIILILLRCVPTRAAPGRWDLLLSNAGVSAMHMQLLNSDRVLIFDLINAGPSNISLPTTKCQNRTDCTAHSVEYDVAYASVRPLTVLTNTWCSSASVAPDGTVFQTGGNDRGGRVARVYKPCTDNSCDWHEINNGLTQPRWYATNHILPDGREIVVGGRDQFNYEFYPKRPKAETSYDLPFLAQTNDPNIENNLYPFVFLNVDGNLFIFANNRAVLYNYMTMEVVKTYPVIPGGDPRNYPSSGSAVLLPLKNISQPEVLVCGGAPKGAFVSAKNKKFVRALDTCGRIRIQDPNPKWVMETMPGPRVMGDMVLLPNGDVIIINGAASGSAGWDFAENPVLSPVIYRPENPTGSRFEIQTPSSTPRMYHSTAILLRDGRVLVGGSNTHHYYTFTGVEFPTDLSLEAFSPSYLNSTYTDKRPQILSPASKLKMKYSQEFMVNFTIGSKSSSVDVNSIAVTMVAPAFATHSFSMNQRLLVLASDGKSVTAVGKTYRIRVMAPGSGILAPPGFYILFVVHRNIPSEGIWVQIN